MSRELGGDDPVQPAAEVGHVELAGLALAERADDERWCRAEG